MNKEQCLEILSKIIVDGEVSLQAYTDKRDIEKFREKIDALKYAKEKVMESEGQK